MTAYGDRKAIELTFDCWLLACGLNLLAVFSVEKDLQTAIEKENATAIFSGEENGVMVTMEDDEGKPFKGTVLNMAV